MQKYDAKMKTRCLPEYSYYYYYFYYYYYRLPVTHFKTKS